MYDGNPLRMACSVSERAAGAEVENGVADWEVCLKWLAFDFVVYWEEPFHSVQLSDCTRALPSAAPPSSLLPLLPTSPFPGDSSRVAGAIGKGHGKRWRAGCAIWLVV